MCAMAGLGPAHLNSAHSDGPTRQRRTSQQPFMQRIQRSAAVTPSTHLPCHPNLWSTAASTARAAIATPHQQRLRVGAVGAVGLTAPAAPPATASPATAAAQAQAAPVDIPVLAGADPALLQLLCGLPQLLAAYQAGNMGAAAAAAGDHLGAAAADLADNQLPQGRSRGWVVPDGSIWYAPAKLMADVAQRKGQQLRNGTWHSIAPGFSQDVQVTVLAPSGPQRPLGHLQQQQWQQGHLLQQQQQEEEVKEEAGQLQQQQQSDWPAHLAADMPGSWGVIASAAGMVSCDVRQSIRLYCTALAEQLNVLHSDHYLLRAQLEEDQLLLYVVPPCFLKPAPPPPDSSADTAEPPKIEQQALPELQALASGVPLQQLLQGTSAGRQRAVVWGSCCWWWPCCHLGQKVRLSNYRLHLPWAMWEALAGGSSSTEPVGLTLQLLAPAAAAAAAASEPQVWHQQQQQQVLAPAVEAAAAPEPQQQQQKRRRQKLPPHAAAAAATAESAGQAAAPFAAASISSSQPASADGVTWVVVQEEAAARLICLAAQRTSRLTPSSMWRTICISWGSWYLFKAQVVGSSTIQLFILPPWAVNNPEPTALSSFESLSSTEEQ